MKNKNARAEIARLIRSEPATAPYSDLTILAFLKARGFSVNYATVQRHRRALGFAVSYERRARRPKPSPIGKTYRSTRQQLRLTQEQFASILGISRSHLAGIENGHSRSAARGRK